MTNTILHSVPLKNVQMLLDASALMEAAAHEDFLMYLRQCIADGCTVKTTPSAAMEFLRGIVGNKETFEDACAFLQSMHIDSVDLHRQGIREKKREYEDRATFVRLFFVSAGKASVTDYELCMCAFMYPEVYIVSGNSRDVPEKFFDRIGVIALDRGKTVHSEMVYKFNPSKFESIKKRRKE